MAAVVSLDEALDVLVALAVHKVTQSSKGLSPSEFLLITNLAVEFCSD